MKSCPPVRQWFKSSRSESSKACVETYFDGNLVGVRDSKDHGPELWFSGPQWDEFLASGVWER